MGLRALTDEEKSKYEKELTDFITQKVKNHGGSLQFQALNHLSNQLSFETKSAVASDKVQLMKFLRSHSKLFKVDSKGIVSIIESLPVALEDDSKELDSVYQDECHLPQCIKNGSGIVCKIHAEFGFINATEPFETKVYFRASAFGADYSLLTELQVQTGAEVGFNAVKGHRESEAQYRADKVWLKDGPVKEKSKQMTEKEIHGEGVVQKLGPDDGLVLFGEDSKSRVVFNKSILPFSTNIKSLDEKFSIGDRVLFTAIKMLGKRNIWEAVSIKKLEIGIDSNESDKTETIQKRKPQNKRSRGGNKEKITNVPGKISPHKTGTNILFGNNFMQMANGDSSVYFLYGCQVTEISWEFSDGDDVLFDAVKIDEEPGWQAFLVWVGEKPDYIAPRRLGECVELTDEEDETDTYQESVASDQRVRKNSDHSVQDADNGRKNEGKIRHSRSQTSSTRSRSKQHYDQESNDFRNQKFKEYSRDDRDRNRSTHSKNKAYSGSSKTAFPEDEYSRSPQRNSNVKSDFSPRYGKQRETVSEYFSANAYENSGDECEKSVPKFLVAFEEDQLPDFSDSVEEHTDEGIVTGFASINVHKGLSCEITRVHCKVVHAKSPCLEDQVTIVLNAFYFHGKSADEEQIDDLREVLSPGNTVNLNCFVIVDDEDKIHHKVTKAWLGDEPQISEMTPEDFISENGLSVTIYNKPEVQDSSQQVEASKRFLQSAEISEESDEFFNADAPGSEYSASQETLNEEKGPMPKCSKFLQEDESSGKFFDFRMFSDLLVKKLREQNSITFSEADPDSLSSEIVNYICSRDQKMSSSVCGQSVENPRRTLRNVRSASKEVQTLITGNIVAQSIFTEL